MRSLAKPSFLSRYSSSLQFRITGIVHQVTYVLIDLFRAHLKPTRAQFLFGIPFPRDKITKLTPGYTFGSKAISNCAYPRLGYSLSWRRWCSRSTQFYLGSFPVI